MGMVDTLSVSLTGMHLVPTIAGSINGKPTTVSINLSAYNTHVTKSVLDKMGITSWNTRDQVIGIDGLFRAMEARIGELKAGPATGRGVFEVLDVDSDVGFNIGADLLLRADLEISLKDKQLKFFRTRNCEKSHLAYWDPNAVVVPFTVVSPDDVRPVFKVKVNGQEMRAMLSTASSHTTLSMTSARKIGLTTDSPLVGAETQAQGLGKNLVPYWEAKIATLEVGEERISNFKMGLIDMGDVDVADLIIGMDFLRAHRIYISMDQRLMYFTYTGGEIFAKTFTSIPAWIQTEIDNGNPDALLRMATMADNAGDTAAATAWYEKAAAKGKWTATLELAMRAYADGNFARSAELFQSLQKIVRSTILSPWHYFATARAGNPAQALTELKASKAASTAGDWYVAVINYLLQEIDGPTLTAMAAKKGPPNQTPPCEANFFRAQNHILQGDPAVARPLLEAALKACLPASGHYRAAKAELARMAR